MDHLEILVVEDDPTLRLAVTEALRDSGHDVVEAANGEFACDLLKKRRFDLLISDIRMPKLDGLELFEFARRRAPETDVILMTAFGEVEQAVACLKSGAFDYLSQPLDIDEIVARVERVRERRALIDQLGRTRAELRSHAIDDIVGTSEVMARLLETIDTIAPSDAPVLIRGETGTGKELIARRIHHLSERRHRPFVAVNCAAFPEGLLEAELFGHEAGAFTGALKKREGRFFAANGGTLLLDEVAEIPPMAQAKLLRVLQERVIEPLGTNEQVPVDVRILSCTHRNLRKMVEEGRFREDLYYRLEVLDVVVPPLRERTGDLQVLVHHFLDRHSNGCPPRLTPSTWAALAAYPFPGNVRELQHVIERALLLSKGKEIRREHLPDEIAGAGPEETRDALGPLSDAVKEFQREYISRALDAAEGKKTRAAKLLSISRKNLWEKCKALGIEG